MYLQASDHGFKATQRGLQGQEGLKVQERPPETDLKGDKSGLAGPKVSTGQRWG